MYLILLYVQVFLLLTFGDLSQKQLYLIFVLNMYTVLLIAG